MKPTFRNEQQVVREMINNDISAFDAVYWKYHKAVYLNIIKLVKDPEVSKDILQEVFVALWIKRQTLNPEMGIGGWLFTTSYHKSVDYLKITQTASRFTREQHIIEVWVDPGKEEEKESRLQLIQQAVSNLSPQKRKVFELCKYKGKTYEETARELNISKYTVKEYLSESLSYIKEYIHGQSTQSLIDCLLILFALYPPVI
ncbi:MAG: sigma-70 family RNA polymerase sigma factor [Chitinophagaceae bacterium]|nr:sigma-70 family RNA polymerase sigma factor [Chitinophagaceae bacterium]